MPTVQDLIVEAIQRKLIVTAAYQGYERVMCPHVIGYKRTENGTTLNALFFQFAGGSKSGLPLGGQWRCVHVSQLSNVSITPGEWHTGLRHTQPQNCVDPPPIAVVDF
jgi:hypothetical protein